MPESGADFKKMEQHLNELITRNPGIAIGGLLGSSISYSLSPAIHNFSAQFLGLAFQYQLFDVPSGCDDQDLSALLTWLWQHGSPGFNITQPFKRRMANSVPSKGFQGQSLSSVNTVFRAPSSFLGTSTDGQGFVASLAHIQCPIDQVAHLVIIGSGGATVAICDYLVASGFRGEIVILSRQGQPLQIQQANGGPVSLSTSKLSAASLETALSRLGKKDLLIQASSAPHRGDDLSNLTGSLKNFEGCFVDLCYGKTSALLAACQSKGLCATDGIAMLIEQARASQILWWGKAAPFHEIQRHLASLT